MKFHEFLSKLDDIDMLNDMSEAYVEVEKTDNNNNFAVKEVDFALDPNGKLPPVVLIKI